MQAIVGGTLIDGSGREPVSDSIVLVGDDGRIAATGPRSAVAVPDNTSQVDAAGMTVMPGLIDCHDHLASFTYDLLSRWGMTEPRSTRTMRIARVIEDTLQSGYTTIRDCGWLDAGFKAAVNEGLITGPRLLVAAGPLGPTHSVQDGRRSQGTGVMRCRTPTFLTGLRMERTRSERWSGRTPG